ncbi:hypothetical protein [Nocardia camponoti]|uniref:BrnT family toxin n=1 Tax=Nocardia camponoti TaxID=1616106 RepID=A0A917QF85_9NOCA|nr:hypothetical protein [Nocardia camponoti]GGK46186.1 hypothetical protein GCM10011591_17020 [Nocardia camponoti]
MGFEWPDWAIAHLIGIEPREVRQVLAAKHRWPRPAGDGHLAVLSLWGRTTAGRALIVVMRQREDWTWVIIGARAMRADELAQFEQWESEQRP